MVKRYAPLGRGDGQQHDAFAAATANARPPRGSFRGSGERDPRAAPQVGPVPRGALVLRPGPARRVAKENAAGRGFRAPPRSLTPRTIRRVRPGTGAPPAKTAACLAARPQQSRAAQRASDMSRTVLSDMLPDSHADRHGLCP